MEWSDAFKRAFKALIYYIAFGLVGFILAGAGLAAGIVGGREGGAGLASVGALLLIVGYIWLFVSGFAVVIKFGSEAVSDIVNRRA